MVKCNKVQLWKCSIQLWYCWWGRMGQPGLSRLGLAIIGNLTLPRSAKVKVSLESLLQKWVLAKTILISCVNNLWLRFLRFYEEWPGHMLETWALQIVGFLVLRSHTIYCHMFTVDWLYYFFVCDRRNTIRYSLFRDLNSIGRWCLITICSCPDSPGYLLLWWLPAVIVYSFLLNHHSSSLCSCFSTRSYLGRVSGDVATH